MKEQSPTVMPPARFELVEAARMRLEEWTRGERDDFWLSPPSADRAFYPIARYIDQYLDEAAAEVCAAFPAHRLQEIKKPFPPESFTVSGGVGFLPLPADFIKLEGVSLPSWKGITVSEVCRPGDDVYRAQKNLAVRGKSAKPIAALARGNIELYSAIPCDTAPSYAYYIPRVRAEAMPEPTRNLVTLQCAITVEGVFGDDARVKLLTGQLETLLQTMSI